MYCDSHGELRSTLAAPARESRNPEKMGGVIPQTTIGLPYVSKLNDVNYMRSIDRT